MQYTTHNKVFDSVHYLCFRCNPCFYVWKYRETKMLVIVTQAIVALVIVINLSTTTPVSMMGH